MCKKVQSVEIICWVFCKLNWQKAADVECVWLCVSVCTFQKIPGFSEKSPEHPKELMRRLPLLSRKVATSTVAKKFLLPFTAWRQKWLKTHSVWNLLMRCSLIKVFSLLRASKWIHQINSSSSSYYCVVWGHVQSMFMRSSVNPPSPSVSVF